MPTQPTFNGTDVETFTIRHESEVRPFISFVRQQGIQAGLNLLNQTKLITAASELVRNMLLYAGGGQVRIESVSTDRKKGIKIVFSDRGPGIADVNLAMQDGFSTGTGLGLGLPGAKRLTDEFMLDTTVGQGTTVTIIKWVNG